MPRSISPAMRERANFVGAFIRSHHHGGKVPPQLMRDAHAAFSHRHERTTEARAIAARTNPDEGSVATEVLGSTAGTLLGLGIFVGLAAWACRGTTQARIQGNPYTGG